MTVDAPDGRTWHVSRQLHWPQWRGMQLLRSRRAMAEVADERRRGVQAEAPEWEAVR